MEPKNYTLAEAQQLAINYLVNTVQSANHPDFVFGAAAVLLGVDAFDANDSCDCWCSADEGEEEFSTETFWDDLFSTPNGTNDTYRVTFP